MITTQRADLLYSLTSLSEPDSLSKVMAEKGNADELIEYLFPSLPLGGSVILKLRLRPTPFLSAKEPRLLNTISTMRLRAVHEFLDTANNSILFGFTGGYFARVSKEDDTYTLFKGPVFYHMTPAEWIKFLPAPAIEMGPTFIAKNFEKRKGAKRNLDSLGPRVEFSDEDPVEYSVDEPPRELTDHERIRLRLLHQKALRERHNRRNFQTPNDVEVPWDHFY